jgi:hypothetical protein
VCVGSGKSWILKGQAEVMIVLGGDLRRNKVGDLTRTEGMVRLDDDVWES